ncbi:MAG: glycosyl hydrolase family 32 [Pirellulales bacterium]|nr:glycosyl hydrolase family 32 [Pirellulales bacterium]
MKNTYQALLIVVAVGAGATVRGSETARPVARGAGDRTFEETLYNGIRLPSPWPPPLETLSLEPTTPPYLKSPPAAITIDVGRQLFVDDFLIEQTTLQRTFHLPEYHPASPVLKPDKPWEEEKHGSRLGPLAMPFSDGVWFDPADKCFKMWYHADYGKRHICYATSADGIRWEKPALDVVTGTNIVYPEAHGARVVWLDLEEKDPARRFKLIQTRGGEDLIRPDQPWQGSRCSMYVHFSPDGIHWGQAVARTGPAGDRNSAFWNPFRKRWVFSIRDYSPFGGLDDPMCCRRYWETTDLIAGLPWKYGEPGYWTGADNADKRPGAKKAQPELYNLDAIAYESLLLGFFCILREEADLRIFRPKINEVCIAFSRDGFHWDRPDRRSFFPDSDQAGAWNWANVQSVGGGCLVVGDKLYFYMSGRKGDAPYFHDAGGSTGLAILRRDGFASLDAGDTACTLTTRPVLFRGRYLFVNADAQAGELRAEVLDHDGNPIAPFTRSSCEPISRDSVLQRITWAEHKDLAGLAGQPVRFRFHLRRARLFAFWVTSDARGASHGYVAAGGPGFTGPTDAPQAP